MAAILLHAGARSPFAKNVAAKFAANSCTLSWKALWHVLVFHSERNHRWTKMNLFCPTSIQRLQSFRPNGLLVSGLTHDWSLLNLFTGNQHRIAGAIEMDKDHDFQHKRAHAQMRCCLKRCPYSVYRSTLRGIETSYPTRYWASLFHVLFHECVLQVVMMPVEGVGNSRISCELLIVYYFSHVQFLW